MILPYILYWTIIAAVYLFFVVALFLKKKCHCKNAEKIISNIRKNELIYIAIFLLIEMSLLMAPAYYSEKAMLPEFERVVHSVVFSFYNSLTLFGFSGNFSKITELKTFFDGYCKSDYDYYGNFAAGLATLGYIIAPIITVTAILSVIKDSFARFSYRFSFKKDIYIFSELNDKSIALAKSVFLSNKGARIVFTDVFSQNQEETYELISKARDIGAICIKSDIASFQWTGRIERISVFYKSYRFFMIGDNENENIEQTIKLHRKYNNESKITKKIRIYLFSNSPSSEFAINTLTHSKDNNIVIIRVDYKRSMVYNYLYSDGVKIIEKAKKDGRINAFIVGMGEHGLEIIKSLIWFISPNFDLHIDVFDVKENIKEHFYALCPDIDKKYIDFHSGMDIDSPFENIFDEAKYKPNFIFVSLGSDSKNISASKKIIEKYIHDETLMLTDSDFNNSDKKSISEILKDKVPIITTVVQNSKIAETVNENTYFINIIGNFKKVYSDEVIINSELEKIAYEVHLAGSSKSRKSAVTYDENAFYEEYNYRSSIALVIFLSAIKKECPWARFNENYSDISEKIYEKNDNLKLQSAREYVTDNPSVLQCVRREKDRWCKYVITEGYRQCKADEYSENLKSDNKKTVITYNKEYLRYHNLISSFDDLYEENCSTIHKGTSYWPALSKTQKDEVVYFLKSHKRALTLLNENESGKKDENK